MDSETYYIPVNYTDAGKLFGLFEIRNAIESVVLGLPVLGLCTALLPFTITWKIIVTLCLLVPTVGFALIGLKDDSLTRYLKTWWTWRRRRRVLTYRGEVNAHEFEKRYRKPPAGGHLRQIRRRRVLHALRRNGMSLQLLHTALRPGFPRILSRGSSSPGTNALSRY